MVRKPAQGPRSAESSIAPQRCPLEPVPGMVKLIIWAAKTKAPITPMRGIFLVSFSSRTFLMEKPATAVEQAYMVPATAGETKASAICIRKSSMK